MKPVRVVDSVTRIAGATVIVAAVTVGLFASGIIPPGGSSSKSPKGPSLKATLQSIRSTLELYRLHHDGAYPKNIVDGLTKKTGADGTVSETGEFGPYMEVFPANPFVDDESKAIETDGLPGSGWYYNSQTGTFRANTDGHKKL